MTYLSNNPAGSARPLDLPFILSVAQRSAAGGWVDWDSATDLEPLAAVLECSGDSYLLSRATRITDVKQETVDEK
jgi:hypothetical protein